jgi:uncharacterized Zn-binding protein involved in type VI secretion
MADGPGNGPTLKPLTPQLDPSAQEAPLQTGASQNVLQTGVTQNAPLTGGVQENAFSGAPEMPSQAPTGLSGSANDQGGGLAGGDEDTSEDSDSSSPGGAGMPAARMGDLHTCPMAPPPHVGGPVLLPCSPNVVTGGMLQARVTDLCVCTGVGGPVDMIVVGSPCVFVNGLPAARVTSETAHGGVIVMGCPTVFIGDCGGGSPALPAPEFCLPCAQAAFQSMSAAIVAGGDDGGAADSGLA